MSDPRIGQVLDRYRIEKLLGQGGFGAVYLAKHVVMNRQVALKILHPEGAQNASVRERFLREAQAAAAVGHRAVVQVFDCGTTEEGEPFLVMELLDGEDLDQRLKREGPMGWKQAVRLVCEVLDALEAVHAAGIIHRDLKPANVFLPRGESGQVKVLDFGISKVRAGEGVRKLTGTGMVLGTPHYMAPESFYGVSKIDGRADLYSVAAMLYEMVSGGPPHDADTYEELIVKVATTTPPTLCESMPGLPSALSDALERGLAQKPEDRWQSAGEFQDALNSVTSAEHRSSTSSSGPVVSSSASDTDINPLAQTGVATSSPPPAEAVGTPQVSTASPSVPAPESPSAELMPIASSGNWMLGLVLALSIVVVGFGAALWMSQPSESQIAHGAPAHLDSPPVDVPDRAESETVPSEGSEDVAEQADPSPEPDQTPADMAEESLEPALPAEEPPPEIAMSVMRSTMRGRVSMGPTSMLGAPENAPGGRVARPGHAWRRCGEHQTPREMIRVTAAIVLQAPSASSNRHVPVSILRERVNDKSSQLTRCYRGHLIDTSQRVDMQLNDAGRVTSVSLFEYCPIPAGVSACVSRVLRTLDFADVEHDAGPVRVGLSPRRR